MKLDVDVDVLIVWTGVILKIIYTLVVSVVVYILQWIVYPLHQLIATCLGDDPPRKPVYPPKCSQIL